MSALLRDECGCVWDRLTLTWWCDCPRHRKQVAPPPATNQTINGGAIARAAQQEESA